MAISKEFVSSEIPELQTDCEVVWAEINIAGTKKITVGTYYRPPSDDGTSLEQLSLSLNRISNTTSSNVWLGGDQYTAVYQRILKICTLTDCDDGTP